jgi:hypothetical protein
MRQTSIALAVTYLSLVSYGATSVLQEIWSLTEYKALPDCQQRCIAGGFIYGILPQNVWARSHCLTKPCFCNEDRQGERYAAAEYCLRVYGDCDTPVNHQGIVGFLEDYCGFNPEVKDVSSHRLLIRAREWLTTSKQAKADSSSSPQGQKPKAEDAAQRVEGPFAQPLKADIEKISRLELAGFIISVLSFATGLVSPVMKLYSYVWRKRKPAA